MQWLIPWVLCVKNVKPLGLDHQRRSSDGSIDDFLYLKQPNDALYELFERVERIPMSAIDVMAYIVLVSGSELELL